MEGGLDNVKLTATNIAGKWATRIRLSIKSRKIDERQKKKMPLTTNLGQGSELQGERVSDEFAIDIENIIQSFSGVKIIKIVNAGRVIGIFFEINGRKDSFMTTPHHLLSGLNIISGYFKIPLGNLEGSHTSHKSHA